MTRETNDLVEGFAQVVALEQGMAWLEPEQTTSCGGCASGGACGAKGVGTVANRLSARRFALPNREGLRVGERVVVGVRESALVRAALVAYAIPLTTLITAGVTAQWATGSDGLSLAAALAGLAVGLLIVRLRAARLAAQGELSPRFLRRAGATTCHID